MKIDFLSKLFGFKKSIKFTEDKPTTIGNYQVDSIIKNEFMVNCVDMSITFKLNKGYVFSLYTRQDLNDVKIFTKETIGGDGFVGFVPSKYKDIIRNHLINTKSYFGNKTVIASLISKEGRLFQQDKGKITAGT